MDSRGEIHEFHQEIVEQADRAWAPVARPLERVQLLGPEPVDSVVQTMESGFADARKWLDDQASPQRLTAPWGRRWSDTMTGLNEARKAFADAAREELRRVPKPGRQP
ncbi:hypothetical protein [Streptomyces sp. NBC_01334]|uniref:hypothetical protein n=1 Tax=Streptomyces sp. NBC_01334 TaxID=2903827 RepID=UPI002E0E7567|nr:hypothetical protein OG736_46335 [Streptomyces sp. NBC_01334]